MPSVRESVQNFYEGHKKKTNVIIFTITAGLTLFDIISDLVLAVVYFINGDYWWGGLTLVFFIVPFIIGVWALCVVIAAWFRNEEIKKFYSMWILWKMFECIWEAGPQLIQS